MAQLLCFCDMSILFRNRQNSRIFSHLLFSASNRDKFANIFNLKSHVINFYESCDDHLIFGSLKCFCCGAAVSVSACAIFLLTKSI